MESVSFLQDLAVVMIVAGLVTLIFLRLKQPVVVGYLLAGVIIGPHTPPFPLVRDPEIIRQLADLGMVFLMFSLGLDFSLRKLRQVGAPALVAATLEISLMMWIGFQAGYFLGWEPLSRVFLGAGLCVSSTAIIVKSLRDRGELKERHGALISGILVMEDIFVILMMVILGGLSHGGDSLPAVDVMKVLLQLFVFLVAAIVVGMLAVPRLLRYAAKFRSDEMILVLVLGICFGVALLAGRLGYSVALGAFIAGAIVAESRERGRVETLTAPMRDLFGAVFFIAIGMQVDLSQGAHHAAMVAVVLVLFMLGKMIACGLGSFLAGYDARTSFRVGVNMAQLGEFSFVIAALASRRGADGSLLYTLFVTVCAVNGMVRPYLVGNADRIGDALSRFVPDPAKRTLTLYSRWTERMGRERRGSPAAKHIRSLVWQISLTMALVAAIFIAATYIATNVQWVSDVLPLGGRDRRTVFWLAAVVGSMPLLVATVRKWQALAMILAEVTVTHNAAGPAAPGIRSVVSGVLFASGSVGLSFYILFLSSALLPPRHILIVLVLVLVVVLVFFGRWFNKSYTRMKFALVEVWNETPHSEPAKARPMPPQLRDADLETVLVAPGPLEGHLIRELQLRTRTGASIVAIERDGRMMVNPSPDEELRNGDGVLLLGSLEQIAAAKKVMANPAGADSALN